MLLLRNRRTRCEAMAEDQQNAPKGSNSKGAVSALHRKTASGRAEHQARVMTLARALRLSVAKIADDLFDMALATLGVRTQEVAGPDLIDHFDDGALLLLLDGPHQRRAAVVIDQALVGALIQQQTMGQVLPHVDTEPRTMTNTDAAICAPFLNALFERIAELPEAERDRQLVKGYQFGARAEDARLLQLAMEAAQYQLVQMDIDVERGNRQGKMTLCLPVTEIEPLLDDAGTDDDMASGGFLKGAKPSLAETVPTLPIELSLILSCLKLPLNRISNLKVGDILALKEGGFDAVEMRTSQGRKVGKGTLGQLDGLRAIRITQRKAANEPPKRRAEDRAGLKQPELGSPGDLQPSHHEPLQVMLPAVDDLPAAYQTEVATQGVSPPGITSELPDMSDIPDFDDVDLPAVAQA